MAGPARKSHPRRSADRATLRLYDPRLSALLRSVRIQEHCDEPPPDLDAWLHGRGVLVAAGGNRRPAFLVAKRVLDVVGALVLLVVLSPLIAAIVIALSVTTRGRPLFRQPRVGQCGRMFVMYKFRTMRVKAARDQEQVPNEQIGPIFKNRRDPRVTRLGYWLRRTSMDEIPQLLNVLRGEMSLVGPRPLPVHEVAKSKAWQFRRLAVKPGLTCLWQVSGRSEIRSFDDWVRLDLWYVQNQSLLNDLRLLLRTPLSVLSCRGAY